MRSCAVVVVAAVACVAALGQPAPAPEAPAVDMTDPAAVVRAYVAACDARDVERAAALTTLDPEQKAALRLMTADVQQSQGFILTRLVEEMGFLPLGMAAAPTVGESSVEGDTARVTATPPTPRPLTYVLKRQEDGTWRLDVEQSILATTGAEGSVMLARVRHERQATATRAGTVVDWRALQRLQELTRLLTEYARETGRFPFADTWMDELSLRCLDPALLDLSDVLPEGFGVAMNAALSGEPFPTDWNERQRLLVLYVAAGAGRNASGNPDDELAAMGEDRAALQVCLASGECTTIPRGMPVDWALMSREQARETQEKLRLLLQALLDYARDHDGRLPSAETWCDEALAYVPAQQVRDDLLRSPALPQAECAWAINSALAGADVRKIRGHREYVLLLPAEKGVRNEARALPERVEQGYFLMPWGAGEGLVAIVGVLDGSTTAVREGDEYPRPHPSAP